MAWSGGTFSRVHDWTTDAGSAINIEADRMDAEDDNFEAGIDACLHKGGQNAATADLPMGGNNHTGVANASALDEYASAEDIIDQHLTYYVDSGSANAYVITPSPAITAYAEGQRFVFRASAANTVASTLNVSGLGAIAIQTSDGSALSGGEIIVGGYYEVIYDANTTPDRWVLMSPVSDTFFASSDVDHDQTTNFELDEHVAHSSVSVTAGSGLTGGGTIDATVTVNVGAGTGITVNADDVAVDESTAWSWTGNSTFAGTSGFNAAVTVASTLDVTGALTASETLVLDSIITPSALPGSTTTSDWAPTDVGTCTVIRASAAGSACLLGGISAGQVDGRVIYFYNVSASNGITLDDEDTGSTAANRFATSGSGRAVAAQSGCTLWYDGTSSRWRVMDL